MNYIILEGGVGYAALIVDALRASINEITVHGDVSHRTIHVDAGIVGVGNDVSENCGSAAIGHVRSEVDVMPEITPGIGVVDVVVNDLRPMLIVLREHVIAEPANLVMAYAPAIHWDRQRGPESATYPVRILIPFDAINKKATLAGARRQRHYPTSEFHVC